MNVTGVPQKVKHYNLTTVAVQICARCIYSLSSVHKHATVWYKEAGLHTAALCLNTGALPWSSGTSAEFIKAEISLYGERRERKAESTGKSLTEFVCIALDVWTQCARSAGELGKEAEPFYLATEGATACRRGGTTEEGIKPHSGYNWEVNWDQNGQQVRLMDQAYGELMTASLPESKRKKMSGRLQELCSIKSLKI